jgi:hypothetical protein
MSLFLFRTVLTVPRSKITADIVTRLITGNNKLFSDHPDLDDDLELVFSLSSECFNLSTEVLILFDSD